MKTPKRNYKQDVCPKCGSVVHWYREEINNGTGYETVDAYGECCNEDCDFSVKGLRDHDGWEDHQQEARWKRKNREARLRRRIARLEGHILWQQEQAQEILDYLKNNMVPFIDSIDTYGHDIEGS